MHVITAAAGNLTKLLKELCEATARQGQHYPLAAAIHTAHVTGERNLE
jgi:hypothetical protein